MLPKLNSATYWDVIGGGGGGNWRNSEEFTNTVWKIPAKTR